MEVEKDIEDIEVTNGDGKKDSMHKNSLQIESTIQMS